MFSRKNKSVRLSFSLRLALIYTSALCFSLAAVLSVTYQLVRHVTQSRDHDVVQAQTIQYKSIFERGGVAAVTHYFSQQAGGYSDQAFVRIVDGTGRVRFETVSHPLWKRLDQNTHLWSRISLGAAQWDELFRDESSGSWVVGTTSLAPGIFLQVGRSTTEGQLVLSQFRKTALIIILPAVILSLLIGWLLTRSAVAPLRALIHTVQKILTTGDLHQRVPDPAPRGELGELTTMFNRMLDQHERLIGDSRATLDNVAHDLRTPMTHLRNATEQALLDPNPDRDVLLEALADCVEESDQILQMLDLLMDLAEADAGHMTLNIETVSLSELVAEVVDLYAFVAEEREITLLNEVTGEQRVHADRLRLRQCLMNLVDNALKYSPKNSEVTLSVSAESEGVALCVSDQGIGMTDQDLPRIWDRLYRGEHSRSTSGLGLGLSYVRAILSAHGGTVEVNTQLNEGSIFTLRLPLTIGRVASE